MHGAGAAGRHLLRFGAHWLRLRQRARLELDVVRAAAAVAAAAVASTTKPSTEPKISSNSVADATEAKMPLALLRNSRFQIRCTDLIARSMRMICTTRIRRPAIK